MSIVKRPGPCSSTMTVAEKAAPERTELCFSRSTRWSPAGRDAEGGNMPQRGLRPGDPS